MRFDEPFENAQWRKVKQIQPMQWKFENEGGQKLLKVKHYALIFHQNSFKPFSDDANLPKLLTNIQIESETAIGANIQIFVSEIILVQENGSQGHYFGQSLNLPIP